ncbi:hypothetical protein [Burkholderia sp. Ac-20379]|nr:hypothetical protein [Burkholderia sp. Ac-20379]
MKSSEVYAILREELGPFLRSLGFRREKALLSWSRLRDSRYTTLWCQVSRDGWDDCAGSRFVMEFQRSERPEAGELSTARARLAALLTDAQRAEVWRLQRQVIASLSQPPGGHPALHVSPDVTRWYLAKFEAPRAPFKASDDIWLRYAKPEHVHMWAEFLRNVLPDSLAAIDAMHAG